MVSSLGSESCPDSAEALKSAEQAYVNQKFTKHLPYKPCTLEEEMLHREAKQNLNKQALLGLDHTLSFLFLKFLKF